MPRTLRVEYPGAIDYLMDRGDRREAILTDDVDRQDVPKSGHLQKPEADATPLTDRNLVFAARLYSALRGYGRIGFRSYSYRGRSYPGEDLDARAFFRLF